VSRYRSRVLNEAKPPSSPLVLGVDALRRWDGLDVEDELRRVDRRLRGVGPGDLSGLASRLTALEAAGRRGRPIAHYAGETPAAVAPMITYQADGIAALGNVGGNLIVFTFDEPAPSVHYNLVYSQTGGATNGIQHQIQTPTLSGFTLVCRTATGGLSNPQTNLWSFSFTVMCPES